MVQRTHNKRLLALDILRGITIAGMILVNNPGSYSQVYAPLQHAVWNGLTPTDLVFPFFMFIMGISTYLSLEKYHFQPHAAVLGKVVKRTLCIFLIGLLLNWLYVFSWEHLRILGVLQRLALCYGVVAMVALFLKHRYIPYLIVLLLVGYGVLLSVGSGFAYNETNILARIDTFCLTPAHIYNDHGLDPEGILSTLPAIAHVLLGFWVGYLLLGRKHEEPSESPLSGQLITLFLCGVLLTFAGFLLSYGCPINKKVWSPTFVLVTCGFASSLLALLIWLMDVKGYKRWSTFFQVFGVNPLFMYLVASVFSLLLGSLMWPMGDTGLSMHDYLFQYLQMFLGDKPASLLYALLFVIFNWALGRVLYKYHIILKL